MAIANPKGKSILLVDDDVNLCGLMRDFFAPFGYEIEDVHDGRRGLTRALEGQFDLVPGCVGEHYIRHDESGDRTVTREAYAAEIAKIRQERPDIRVVVYDHGFEGNRAWFRFAFKWTDAKTGEPRAVARACSLTEPRAVSLLRRGCQCSLSGRRGATPPLRSIGRARRRSSEGRALPSAA